MRIRIFKQLDPRENKLPADTSHIIQKKPHRTLPLVDPRRFVQNNPAIQRMVAAGDPVNPKAIRADAIARIRRMVDEANRMISSSIRYTGIRFDVDEDSGRSVAVVRDRRTGEVLRQVPSDQVLTMAARLRETSGLMKDISV